MIAIAMQYRMMFYPIRYLADFIIFALASYLIVLSLLTDAKDDIRALKKMAKKKKKKSSADIRLQLIKFINLHSDIKQLCES